MKFVIVSTKQSGGGLIVLYRLAKTLEGLGYDASIFNIGKVSDNRFKFIFKQLNYWFNEWMRCSLIKLFPDSAHAKRHYQGYVYFPVKGCKRKLLPIVDDDTIVVYPEIVRENPLHAKHMEIAYAIFIRESRLKIN